jgi:hypothetical protein
MIILRIMRKPRPRTQAMIQAKPIRAVVFVRFAA